MPDAHRIKDLSYNGKPVADDQVFVVATNNYRAGGGGNFPGADGTTIVLDAPDLTRDAIMRYIIERKEVSPKADGSWALVTPPAERHRDFPHRAERGRLSARGHQDREDGRRAGRLRQIPHRRADR